MKIVTPNQMKLLEATADRYGTTYKTLMNNAGFTLAEEIKNYINQINKLKNQEPCKILFLCGNGNNAGDCFVASRMLHEYYNPPIVSILPDSVLKNRLIDIKIALLCGNPKTDLSKDMFLQLPNYIEIFYEDEIENIKSVMKQCDIVCDGIFGTGFHGELPIDIQEVLSVSTKAVKIAVDIPSGVDGSTGRVSAGTLISDTTITFAYPKIGMLLYPARRYCGKIKVLNIGINENHYINCIDFCIESLDAHNISLPYRADDGNKGTFGKLLHITGSKNMVGACIMASKSALRCGVGLLSVCTENHSLLPLAMPEPIYVDRSKESILDAMKKSSTILIGCGLGTSEDTEKMFIDVVKNSECPVIIDADGINMLSKCIDIIKDKNIVITPHPMEMARLTHLSIDDVQSNRLKVAINFAKEHHCVVILKGAGTIVTNGKYSFIDPTANSGMSKGGSGDVLAGMVSSFIAQGMDILEACKLSVYIHSRAGLICAKKLSKFSMLPTDIIDEIPNVIKSIKDL